METLIIFVVEHISFWEVLLALNVYLYMLASVTQLLSLLTLFYRLPTTARVCRIFYQNKSMWINVLTFYPEAEIKLRRSLFFSMSAWGISTRANLRFRKLRNPRGGFSLLLTNLRVKLQRHLRARRILHAMPSHHTLYRFYNIIH